MNQVDYPDYESAYQAVKEGNAWGVIQIPTNFSKSLLTRLWSSIDATEETLNKSSIEVIYLLTQSIQYQLSRSSILSIEGIPSFHGNDVTAMHKLRISSSYYAWQNGWRLFRSCRLRISYITTAAASLLAR